MNLDQLKTMTADQRADYLAACPESALRSLLSAAESNISAAGVLLVQEIHACGMRRGINWSAPTRYRNKALFA